MATLTDVDALEREMDAFDECYRCNRPVPDASPDEYCSDECAEEALLQATEIAERTGPCFRCGVSCTPPSGWPQCCQQCANDLVVIGLAVWDIDLLCVPCRTTARARGQRCFKN